MYFVQDRETHLSKTSAFRKSPDEFLATSTPGEHVEQQTNFPSEPVVRGILPSNTEEECRSGELAISLSSDSDSDGDDFSNNDGNQTVRDRSEVKAIDPASEKKLRFPLPLKMDDRATSLTSRTESSNRCSISDINAIRDFCSLPPNVGSSKADHQHQMYVEEFEKLLASVQQFASREHLKDSRENVSQKESKAKHNLKASYVINSSQRAFNQRCKVNLSHNNFEANKCGSNEPNILEDNLSLTTESQKTRAGESLSAVEHYADEEANLIAVRLDSDTAYSVPVTDGERNVPFDFNLATFRVTGKNNESNHRKHKWRKSLGARLKKENHKDAVDQTEDTWSKRADRLQCNASNSSLVLQAVDREKEQLLAELNKVSY